MSLTQRRLKQALESLEYIYVYDSMILSIVLVFNFLRKIVLLTVLKQAGKRTIPKLIGHVLAFDMFIQNKL